MDSTTKNRDLYVAWHCVWRTFIWVTGWLDDDFAAMFQYLRASSDHSGFCDLIIWFSFLFFISILGLLRSPIHNKRWEPRVGGHWCTAISWDVCNAWYNVVKPTALQQIDFYLLAFVCESEPLATSSTLACRVRLTLRQSFVFNSHFKNFREKACLWDAHISILNILSQQMPENFLCRHEMLANYFQFLPFTWTLCSLEYREPSLSVNFSMIIVCKELLFVY